MGNSISSAGFRIGRRSVARFFRNIALVDRVRIISKSRTAITAPCLGVLIRARVSGRWVPIFWSFVGALLRLRFSLL
jgi:hypothetical protein